tara:strand:- start:222 stop:626 length:405 start_codon:yes stop_codon:yes gene_type:complete
MLPSNPAGRDVHSRSVLYQSCWGYVNDKPDVFVEAGRDGFEEAEQVRRIEDSVGRVMLMKILRRKVWTAIILQEYSSLGGGNYRITYNELGKREIHHVDKGIRDLMNILREYPDRLTRREGLFDLTLISMHLVD